jgi:hypothetical protein
VSSSITINKKEVREHESRFLLLGKVKYLPEGEGVSFAKECGNK